MRFIKPLDEEFILEIVANHDLIVTLEDNVVQGGAGSGVSELLASKDIVHPLIHYGMPDRLLNHGSREDMLRDAALTSEGLLAFIQRHTGKTGAAKKVSSA
jgi:1-deoxy-D-xylulose-5-phosphate synthase